MRDFWINNILKSQTTRVIICPFNFLINIIFKVPDSCANILYPKVSVIFLEWRSISVCVINVRWKRLSSFSALLSVSLALGPSV